MALIPFACFVAPLVGFYDGIFGPGALAGTLAIAGIYLSQVPPLDYERHLFYERTLRSVTLRAPSAYSAS